MSDAGQAAAGDAGAQAGANGQGQVAGAGGDAGQAQTFDWSKQGLDADTSSYVAAKGWKTPADVLQSYRSAEKLIGVSPDKVVKLQDGIADNFELFNTNVADKLGRPKDPAGYELGKLVPQGGDPKFADAAAAQFHKLGILPSQAKALTEWWNGQAGEMTKAQTEANTLRDTQQITSLKAEWGQQFDSNSQIVDKAAATFGMTADQVNALKAAMGPGAAMKFLHNIGSKMGVSDAFIDGENRQTNFAGGMSQDQAKLEIETLKKDKTFMDKYIKGETDAKNRMRDLHARAFPGTLTF